MMQKTFLNRAKLLLTKPDKNCRRQGLKIDSLSDIISVCMCVHMWVRVCVCVHVWLFVYVHM